MRRILTSLLLAGLCGTAAADLTLTPDNTKVEWTGKKPQGKHTGGFKRVSGRITGDKPEAAMIEVAFETDSLYSDDEKLTGHLKSPDFFDVKTHKTAGFKSSKVEKTGDRYTVRGDLTLCGKTKEISFPADISMTGGKLTLSSEFSINRLDFGCGTKFSANKIEDKVDIRVKVAGK